MQITPLIWLAKIRAPALTDAFSDRLAVTTMAVTAGGDAVLTTAAAHGIAVDATTEIIVIDAEAPNAITAWSVDSAGDIVLTVANPHDLSTTPDATLYPAFDSFAHLSGTGLAAIEGQAQLVSVPDRTHLVVRPRTPVASLPAVPEAAVLLQRLERGMAGFHVATSTGARTLAFLAPDTVTRDYTVTAPVVATAVRCWGAVDLLHAMGHFTRENEPAAPIPDRGWMFVMPRGQAQVSRDRASRSDATFEIESGIFVRQTLIDGFQIAVVLPAESYGGAVACMDRCRGEILRALFKTFNGVVVPWAAFAAPGKRVAMMESHGTLAYDRANYVHGYVFQTSAMITNGDCADPLALPDLAALDAAVYTGTEPITEVPEVGSVPVDAILFEPGIYAKDRPKPLLATIDLTAPE